MSLGLAATGNKPQTTRRRVLGIASGDNYQIAIIDTPGVHEPHTRLGRSMVDQARSALGDIDLILYVTDISKMPNEEDKEIAEYRVNGKLYMVRVTPRNGKPYTMIDHKGDGTFSKQDNTLTPNLVVPQWVLLEF